MIQLLEQLRQEQIPIISGGIPLDNLFSYYRLDGDATDSKGTNDATGLNMTYPTGQKMGTNCGDFTSAANNYIEIPDADAFSFTDGVNDRAGSISFYVKFDVATSTNVLIGKRGSTTNPPKEYNFIFSGGSLYWAIYSNNSGNNTVRVIYAWTPNLDQWYQVVGTYDGSEVQGGINLYVDGVNVGSQATAGTYEGSTNTTANVTLGGQGTSGDRINLFDGKLDGVGFWNKELSQAEVTAIYDEQNLGNELI